MNEEENKQEYIPKKYDILKMYFCEDYEVCEGFSIHQPTIGEIIEYGESDFWVMAGLLCANTTSMRLSLWENGIDWNEISDFKLFTIIASSLNVKKTRILFGDIDFSQFRIVSNSDNEDDFVMVYMPNPTIQIDKNVYSNMVGYLRIMFDINPKVEKAKGKATKEAIIWEEQQNLKRSLENKSKEKWKPSTLFPLISALLNHPGFKYKKSELKKIGIVEFLDSVRRLQVYESTTSLMTGMYMGMIDMKNIDAGKELNWTRNLYED